MDDHYTIRGIAKAMLSIAVFLVGWELLARSGLVDASLFPPPTQVGRAFTEWARSGDLVRDLDASLWRAIVGFALGGFVGVFTGVITGRIETVSNYLSPILQIFRPLPPVAIIPLVIVWYGIGEVSKVFSIAFAVFFPVWISTHIGARQIAQTYIWTAQSLNVKGTQALRKVIFPGALPFIVAGLRTGIAIAFVMVFVSELAGASSGIGYQISVSNLAYRVDRMMAALILLGVLGAAADVILARGMKVVFPWLKFTTPK